jgi:hypothetical protein
MRSILGYIDCVSICDIYHTVIIILKHPVLQLAMLYTILRGSEDDLLSSEANYIHNRRQMCIRYFTDRGPKGK